MSAPKVSVLILAWNGMQTLPAVVDAVRKQSLEAELELVAVDSGSTDGTLALLHRHADRLLQVDHDTFRHGETRNLGIEACRGERVALLVQDAEPKDSSWLARLVAPLGEEGVAGVFSRQYAREDASSLTRHNLEAWVAAREEPRRVRLSEAEFELLQPLERLERCAFDNVSSAISKAVWRQHPFPAKVIAEDLAWAKEVLFASYTLAYAPGSGVMHSHERSARYEVDRTRLLHEQLYHLFGVETIGSVGALVRSVATSLPLHLRCLASDLGARRATARDLLRVPALAFAWPLGQLLGARRARRGAIPVGVAGV